MKLMGIFSFKSRVVDSYSHRFAVEAARTDRNLCSRSRESVVWGSGREREEAVRRYSHYGCHIMQSPPAGITGIAYQ